MCPITSDELSKVLKAMAPSTAKGLDGMGVPELRRININTLLDLVNNILLDPPDSLLRARVTNSQTRRGGRF